MEVLSNDNSKSLLTPCIFVFSRPEDVDLEVCVFAVATGDQLLWNKALAGVELGSALRIRHIVERIVPLRVPRIYRSVSNLFSSSSRNASVQRRASVS